MPLAYRTMKAEGNPPLPVLGESATTLGVRVRDLAPDEASNARRGRGGVSVVSSIAGLRGRLARGLFSPNMVPHRLSELGKVPGAIGPRNLHLFRIGEGAFVLGELAERLMLIPDHDYHGTIQPAVTMPYREYKTAITDTRDRWVSGEGDDDR